MTNHHTATSQQPPHYNLFETDHPPKTLILNIITPYNKPPACCYFKLQTIIIVLSFFQTYPNSRYCLHSCLKDACLIDKDHHHHFYLYIIIKFSKKHLFIQHIMSQILQEFFNISKKQYSISVSTKQDPEYQRQELRYTCQQQSEKIMPPLVVVRRNTSLQQYGGGSTNINNDFTGDPIPMDSYT